MTDALAPCPFCGGPARLVETVARYVQCNTCWTETRSFVGSDAEQLAITAWNTRANPPTPAGEPELAKAIGHALFKANAPVPLKWAGTDLEYCEKLGAIVLGTLVERGALASPSLRDDHG